MKPVALLVGEDGFDVGIGGAHYVINKNYAECTKIMGAVPYLAYDIRNAEDYVKFADLLFLTGGSNIHPAWYHGYYKSSAQMEGLSQDRDDLDFTLCRRFIEERKPILAIGRGMQVVNVALGGTLCSDICKMKGQNHKLSDPQQLKLHRVWASCNSILSEVCGNSFYVNSYHEQAVECLGKGLRVLYQAEDGIVEAVMHNTLPILGIQWHPEQKDWNGNAQTEVFEAFGSWIGLQDSLQEKHKPLVLVNGGSAYDRQFQGSSWVANKTYPSVVSVSGGVPVMPLEESETEEYASCADALILTGSISYTPKEELREKLIKEELPKREQFDEKLFWSFYKKRKPILGICLGHQIINSFLGGTLESRFKYRTGTEHMLHQHQIRTEKESVLSALFGEEFWVNSRHNDKIDRLAEELRVTAWSRDGVIEAFEHKALPIYGVEWHPERMRGDFKEPPEGPDMTRLFEWFIQCF